MWKNETIRNITGLLILLPIILLVGVKLTYGENINRLPRSVSPGSGITSGDLNDTAGDGTYCPCSPTEEIKQGDDGHSSVNEPTAKVYTFPDDIYAKEYDSDSVKKKVSEFTNQLSLGQELFDAFENRDYDRAKELVLKHPEIVNYRNEEGMPAVVKAIRSNQKELVKLFLSLVVNPDSKDGNGVTLLHHAVDYDSVEIAKLLLDNGASIEKNKSEPGSTIDKNSQVPAPLLQIAVGNRNPEMVKLLLSSGADINLRDERGCTAFYYAVKSGESSIACFLIDKGAEVNTKTSVGRTPLHVVRDLKLARHLIDKGLDVNAIDIFNSTPLHMLLASGFSSNEGTYSLQRELSLLYLANGADVNAKNGMNQTPLHYAVINRDTRLIRIFLSKNARVDIRDIYDRMPIDFAIKNLDPISCLLLLRAHLIQNKVIRFIFLLVLMLAFILAYRKFFMKKNKSKPE